MHINAGDTAWMLTSTALVLFMMPGLALFYGGLVGAKNVVATMAQSFAAIGVVSLLWVIVGYSLAFGSDHAGVIGSLSNVLLRGVGVSPNAFAPTIPALLYMAFQMKFAVITPALIAGAFCERMRFRGYLVFIGLWSRVGDCPCAPAECGGGWRRSGRRDRPRRSLENRRGTLNSVPHPSVFGHQRSLGERRLTNRS